MGRRCHWARRHSAAPQESSPPRDVRPSYFWWIMGSLSKPRTIRGPVLREVRISHAEFCPRKYHLARLGGGNGISGSATATPNARQCRDRYSRGEQPALSRPTGNREVRCHLNRVDQPYGRCFRGSAAVSWRWRDGRTRRLRGTHRRRADHPWYDSPVPCILL